MEDSAVRIAVVNDDIQNHLKLYSDRFMDLPLGDRNIRKYGLFIREASTYFFTISQRDRIVKTPNNGSFNVMITVMGGNQERALEILKEFEKKMPFKLKEAPEELKKGVQLFTELAD